MKFSFSVQNLSASFHTCTELAQNLKFQGLELFDVGSSLFSSASAPFHDYSRVGTMRDLFEKKLEICCLTAKCDLALDAEDAVISEITESVDTAKSLHIPYVGIHTALNRLEESSLSQIHARLSSLIRIAEDADICLLVETTGCFARSEVLRETLQQFSCDALGALWNLSDAMFFCGESPEQVICNLGAYVRHVRYTDFVRENGEKLPCLAGQGELPMSEITQALSSVNYDGYLSLYWNPAWCPELDDTELILSQFINTCRRYNKTGRKASTLNYNKTNTGRYVWKKDLLIDLTFSQLLDRMVAEFPDQYAFRYTTLDYTRTYSEFRDDVDRFAASLLALGVKSGSHVAVWASNVPQWFIAFWATTKIGAVLVSVNTAYKIHEAEYLFRQSDTHTVIITQGSKDTDYSAIIHELCPELNQLTPGRPLHAKKLPFLRNVITVGFSAKGCLTWDDALRFSDKISVDEVNRLAAKVNPNDVCNMQYTSGTTGFPKGVMLTHNNIVNNGKCIGDRMDLSTADRMMVQVPMFHCFGMVLAMTAAMTHGTTLYPLPYFSPKPALACIHIEHITAFHGVPTMFIAMLEHEDFTKTDFSYMRTGIMAGSPCPISVMQDVLDKMHMKEITIVYGQTEASPGCTMSSTDDPIEVRVGTVGRPLPEIECKIVNPETGEDCPDNVTGEFLARGYNIMKGYYKMPKATASAIDANGWLHTGDLACRTPEGNFRITGRLKDMIIRGGENIYPKEIEELIYTHPKVSDVQVIGVPSEQYGEEVMACIILKAGETMTAEEMKAYVSERMARHKVPRYIDFVDSFPMNVAGKILKYKMREQAIEKLGLHDASEIVTA